MGGLNSPLERQEKKEKLILKPHRSSGKQSNKDWQQQSEQAIRENPEQSRRKFHHVLLACTLLLPGAVQSWSAPSCLPQTKVITENLCAMFQPTWGLFGDCCLFHLTLNLNWRAARGAITAARGLLFLGLFSFSL